MQDLIKDLSLKLNNIYEGGGKQKQEAVIQSGKLTARQRIDYLFDKQTESIEIGALAGYDMYDSYGGCPSGGVIVKIGFINTHLTIVVANDATVKAGAWFPITAKKNLRAQEIAIQNKIPIVYLVDSAGVFLPLQAEVFADKEHFGRIFNNNAKMSAMGIPQIAAVMGSCVAGGAYLPILSDEVIMVAGQGQVFLAGSALVKAAIGEQTDNETLGGADTHCDMSGVADYKVNNDLEALNLIKELIGKITHPSKANYNRIRPQLPKEDQTKLLQRYNPTTYDMLALMRCLVDDSELEEYKNDYGKTLITAYARIDGWSVGIIANRRAVTKNAKGEVQLGGVIYSDSADKASRFIANCNQKKIPIIFLQDVTGFMVGTKAEHHGIIKDGAKMVNMMSNSVVPKFTVIIGNAYGAGHYAMCSRAFDPNLIIAWPTAHIGVMGATQATNVLAQIKHNLSEEEKINIKKEYEQTTSPYHAAGQLWIDAIINPLETRKWISLGIEVANYKEDWADFKTGVIQV